MRNIDIDSLEIFKAVVDCGGITKAAARLNRVQSNITTRVKNLEERLQVSLFHREGGKLVLTAEGHLLLTYAERLLRLSTEAEAALRSRSPSGRLRIGTLESTAAARLPPLLSSYHERYPEVQLELVTGDTTSMIERVRSFDVEAAFVSDPFLADDLEARPAFTEELMLIGSKDVTSLAEARQLAQRTVIAFATGCSYRRILEDWLSMSKIIPERILELTSYHAITACVAAGSGIGIMPRSVLRAVHAVGQVQALPLPPKFAQTCTHLIWRPGYSSVALEALQEELSRCDYDERASHPFDRELEL
ncbi:LysR family transcriptional regulator [Agrobacterium sp. 22-221-1]